MSRSASASPSRLERLAAALLAGAAVAAYARSDQAAPAWLLLLPCLAAPFVRPLAIPERLLRAARAASRALLVLVFAVGWTVMAYPVLSERAEALARSVAGYGLLSLAALFLLAAPKELAETFYPCVAGALAAACLNPERPLRAPIAVAGVALFLLLAARPGAGRARRRLALLAVAGSGAAAVAWGIVLLLPVAQGKVEEIGLGMLSGGAASGPSVSAHARLGEMERLKLSREVVLRLWAPSARKLRSRVFVAFDGQAWRAQDNAASPLLELSPDALAGTSLAAWAVAVPGTLHAPRGADWRAAGLYAARIVPRVSALGLLPAPGDIRLVRSPIEEMRIDAFGVLRPPDVADVYGVVAGPSAEHPDASAPDARMREATLAVPSDTDPRLRELAERLAAGMPTPRLRVHRTVSYVASAARYSLSPGRFRSRQPVAEFLFEKKQGYCEYFASAAVLLLRLQGVPARYVTGFNVQEGNRSGGHYVVRASDAHAWVEAWVEGPGWVEADPTPAAEYEALHAGLRDDVLEAALEDLRARWAELLIALRFADWKAQGSRALAALGLIGLAWAGGRLWARRRRGRATAGMLEVPEAPVAPELLALMTRLEAEWARRGVPRPASCAPLEHARSIPEAAQPAERRAAGIRVVEGFYRARFGGRPPTPDELDELRRLL